MIYRLDATNGSDVRILNNPFVDSLTTTIRDIHTDSDVLKNNLYDLGKILGQGIASDHLVLTKEITTPLNMPYTGKVFDTSKDNVIISTLNDYDNFANGIASIISNCYRGYIDFGNSRGPSVFSSPIRAIELPNIISGRHVKYVIIAKSVIATSCTAVSLAKKSIEKYMPDGIIVASIFYCERGIMELHEQIPNAKIYVCMNPDTLSQNGMLIPGIGNLDERIKQELH